MGQGIAQLVATCGLNARMYDAAPERAAAALHAIGERLIKSVASGKLTDETRRAALARLTIAPSIPSASADANFVIEAITEQMSAKVDLFRLVARQASSKAIFATNTSSLSITELGSRIGTAERTIGLHFFNPPPTMELIEIIRGDETSQSTVDASLALASALGKTPILVRDVPGFATSRLGVILGAEAIRMLETGVASAEDIDRGMELGYRHPMGPLKLTDWVGLDVRLAILEHLHAELGEQFRPPALLLTMVKAGKLGKKTGEGFYVWKNGVAIAR